MSERLIKPYEISIWEDKLINGAFEEIKLAVIGSDTMTGLNKVYDPVFNKKSNGEKTLSFSLRYKYFDPYSGNSDFVNPFAALLINERKVKLHYDNKWYEFIIKDHTESSDGLEWTYTCTDAFVLELSKSGYNITFDSELNNNQGTARELAEKTLENTDWQVDEADVGRQLVAEPIYKATLVSISGVTIINTDNPEEQVRISAGTSIYLFYNYVKNQNGKFIQFIVRDDDYVVDDNNVIIDTNFRITTELTYKSDGFYLNSNKIISWGEIESLYQAYRLVYNQLTTYDPIMGRTVDRYKVTGKDYEVYKYTDYTYTTSNVLTNLITNGENFNILEDGTLQGWNPYVDFTGRSETNKKPEPLELVTRPELATGKPLADLSTLSQIEGFLKVKFKGTLTSDYKNAVYNSGFENNASIIGSVAKGDKFVFRWRATVGELENSRYTQQLRLLVAKYTQDSPGWGYYYKHINPSDIILQFDGQPTRLNNYITGGTIDANGNYVIDGIVQTPSTKYIYKVGDNEYVWNGTTGEFELRFETGSDNNYIPYYYLIAEAQESVSNTVLTDPKEKIGIFLYHVGNTPERTFYIQDVQLTRYIPDADGQPLILGNIPTATSIATDYYYIQPSDDITAEEIETYTSVSGITAAAGGQIEPLYNTNSEKNLSISASKSNCFNILQTIAETFECWVDLVVGHDERGYITYQYQLTTDTTLDNSKTYYIWDDINQIYKPVSTPSIQEINTYYERIRPNKYVCLKEYAGTDNYAGFKYGINLQSIERTVNSDEIVTKLIVDQSQSEYTDEGFVSISNAPSNVSGESYILNFDYYYNQGLLNREESEKYKLNFINAIAQKNKELQEKEIQRRDLEASLVALESKRNVFTELITTAEDTLNDALMEFENLTKQSYEQYKEEHSEIPQDDQLTSENTIFDVLGKIYINSATINNYTGLLTNVEQEYWKIRRQLRGSERYSVKLQVGTDSNNQRHVFITLSDYLPGFAFTIGGNTERSTVSKKYWDITTEARTILFTAPEGYEMEMARFTFVTDDEVPKIAITPTVSVNGIEDEIKIIQDQKDELTKEFNNKYSRYIQEGTWNSTDYIDSEQYYLDALQVSNTSAQPTVSYSINVVEVSQLEGLELYSFDAGDKTYVEDTEFFGWANVNGHLTPAKEEVIVSEVEWHLDRPEENVITVQNYKTRFEDLFQRIAATVQTVQYNEATYAKISSLLDANGRINQNVLLDSLNRISGEKYNLTSDGSVLINGDQILVQNLTNPANRVIINSEGIRISSDGGQTWKTAIDGQGINIGAVYTGTLNTNNIIIGSSDNPSFRWDKSGISAYKNNAETYIKTTDTTVDNSKTYYIKDENTGEYIVVENPTQGNLNNYYEKGTQYDLKTYVRYDQYGLYGIKSNGVFKAETLQDVLDNAHFAVTWDGFFIKNSYTDGRVEITSDNDFRVVQTLTDSDQQKKDHERIKIGALEFDANGNPTKYGININQTVYNTTTGKYEDIPAFTTGDDGNITITGVVNATGGNFSSLVTVGKDNNNNAKPYIKIDGSSNTDATISSSKYVQDGASYGWMINAEGDAVFNNITARGAIRTAVFEYAEIQAVGGIFIFRPSSTIRNASRVSNTDDIQLTLEKPFLFKVGDWCKISNYTDGNGEPIPTAILSNNGLTHVYKVKSIDSENSKILILENAYSALTSGTTKVINDITDLIGGALIDMGDNVNGNGKVGTSNYGVGINSSDNVVNLPARAISLFETVIDETRDPKVSYNYRGILGTLPYMSSGINSNIYQYMQHTQGIYTDNMYIGDNSQYIAFYTDTDDLDEYNRPKKKLKISAREMIFGYDDSTGEEITWEQKIDNAAQANISIKIESSQGELFTNGTINTTLICRVYKGMSEITNTIETFNWYINGSIVSDNHTQTLIINSSNIDKIVVQCQVEVNEGD